jgi:RND family efflux transporter MFP subunit
MRRLALAALLLVTVACERSQADSAKPAAPAPSIKPVPVTTARAETRAVQRSVETVGSLTAWEESQVKSEVPGTIERIYADLGDRVKAGDVLARLDTRLFRLDVEHGEATLRVARENRTRLEAEVDDARANTERAEELHRRELISTQERDRARTTYRVAQAQLQASTADIARSEATLNMARKKLGDTAIRAPIAGAVAKRYVNVGEYVSATSINTTPLFTIVALDPLKYAGTVPERVAPDLKIGQTVELRVEAYGEQAFRGQITRLAPAVDVPTRTLVLEGRVPNADGRLRPGFFAKGVVLTRRDEQVVFVPQEAIAYLVGLNKVFVVAGGKAQERAVKPGARAGTLVEVDGVKPGEVVATSNLAQLFEGAPVEITAARTR